MKVTPERAVEIMKQHMPDAEDHCAERAFVDYEDREALCLRFVFEKVKGQPELGKWLGWTALPATETEQDVHDAMDAVQEQIEEQRKYYAKEVGRGND